MTATQITAALRACAAGFYAEEAGTELLISHGGFLDRPGLIRFVDTFASAHDGTPMAQIDWQSLQIAWREGQLDPVRRRMAHPQDRCQPRRRRRSQPPRHPPRPR